MVASHIMMIVGHLVPSHRLPVESCQQVVLHAYQRFIVIILVSSKAPKGIIICSRILQHAPVLNSSFAFALSSLLPPPLPFTATDDLTDRTDYHTDQPEGGKQRQVDFRLQIDN